MRFPGIIPAVTTPFDGRGQINVDGLTDNVERLLAAGVHGFVATGTMGESASLTLSERELVTQTVCEAVAGRAPVLGGIAAPTARVGAEYAEVARRAGATALMVLPPLNYSGDTHEIAAFYAAIGDVSGLPIMAYNNPGASGVELSVTQIAELATAVPSVVAVKECSGETRNIAALIGATSDDFEVLVGGDDFALEGFCAGATGWISGVANAAPAACVELHALIVAGDLTAAQRLYQRMLPLARLDFDPKLVQYFKAAMDRVGFTGGLSREPRLPLTENEEQILDQAMSALAPVAAVA
jgi:dihydrodipicolinate synthase/N-acetylneuraminate lyase